MSSVMVTDPEWAAELTAKREASDGDKWNEVWEGMLVMPTLPNDEHQEIQCRIMLPLILLYEAPQLGKVRAGVNVSDRDADWRYNFRGPDVVLYLPDNPAANHGTHWVGGPDFLVEIISPGDLAWEKLDFYAEVGTREVLIVDRDPWRLELHQLREGSLELAGVSEFPAPAILASAVMPLTFQLRQGPDRPVIHLAHSATGQTWTA